MTNPAHIAETALLLLAAYLLGCVLGYAARRILHAGRGTRVVAVATPAPAAAVTVPAVVPAPAEPRRPRSPAIRLAASVDDLPQPTAPVSPPVPNERPIAAKAAARKAKLADGQPAALAEPRMGGADNLKQIKGIGPKIEASLHGMGIFHIDQIAGWSKANIEWVEGELAFKGRVRRERWVEQAVTLGKARITA